MAGAFMKIQISGKQMDVGDALRTHTEQALKNNAAKYFEQAVDAVVVFHKEGHRFVADVTIHLGTGSNIAIHGHAEATEAYAACDTAIERIAKQMRRYKRRLKAHHHNSTADSSVAAVEYIMAQDHAEEEPAVDAAPAIIAEMQKVIETMAVSEAVMRLDLAGTPLFVFNNSRNGTLNVVYRRPDGNIGWIDPTLKAA
jgi:ribosomal subunit interface protein